MRSVLALGCGSLIACAHSGGQPSKCIANTECTGDQYCDLSTMQCLPWGVGPGGNSDRSCAGTAAPGAFFPTLQCAWLGPPASDAFPDHSNVLATPMVATLDDPATPSIVVTSYNGVDDHGGESCAGSDPRFYGVIRVLDGKTCEQRATIASPSVIGSAPVAIGDL